MKNQRCLPSRAYIVARKTHTTNGKHNELLIMLLGDECFGKVKVEQDGGKESGLQFKLGRSHGEDDISAKTQQ